MLTYLCNKVILNSDLMWFFIKNTSTELSGGFFRFKTNYLKPFPLPKVPSNSQEFIEKTELILELNQKAQELVLKFLRTIERKFGLTDFSKDLQNWYSLTFKEFIDQLRKKKVKLSLSDESEWEDYFLAEKTKTQHLYVKINEVNQIINTMVYELYGLNSDEIRVVENS